MGHDEGFSVSQWLMLYNPTDVIQWGQERTHSTADASSRSLSFNMHKTHHLWSRNDVEETIPAKSTWSLVDVECFFFHLLLP